MIERFEQTNNHLYSFWVLIGAMGLLVLAFFPAIFLDSTMVEYNRLPIDGLPNVELYTPEKTKKAPKIPSALAPHHGPPSRSGWESPSQYHPLYQYENLAFAKGEWPWWDPTAGLGMPLFAAGLENLFNPVGLLFYWIPPKWWDLIYLAMMAAMSVFVFYFLRLFNLALSVAIPLAIASPLMGTLPISSNFGGETLTTCFFPFAMWMTESFIRRPTWRNIGGLIFSIHLFFTSGMPEATLALFTFIWIYFIVRLFETQDSISFKLSLWIIIYSGGALWTSPKWVHIFHNLSLGETRGHAGHVYLPIDALLGWMFRYFGGWDGSQILHPQWDKIAQVGHLGVVGCLCLLGVVLHWRRVTSFSLIFSLWPIFYILKNYGVAPWFSELVGSLPIYNGMWFFRFFSPTLHLCQIVLVGAFLNFLLQQPPKWRKQFAWQSLGFLAVMIAIVLWVISDHAQYDTHHPGWQLASKQVGFALIWGLGWIAITGFSKSRSMILIGLCTILMLESWQGVPRRRYSPRIDPYAITSYVAFLQEQSGVFRTASLGNFLFPRNSGAVGVSNISYHHPIKPVDLQRFFGPLRKDEHFSEIRWPQNPEMMHRALSGINIRYLIAKAPDRPQKHVFSEELPPDRWKSVYVDAHAQVFENQDVMERAFLVDDVQLLTPEVAEHYTIMAFADNLTTAYLSLEELPSWAKTIVPETAGATTITSIEQTTGSSLTIRAETAVAQFLVISNTFYPGWQATIDGTPTEIYQTNLTLQGIFLPAGQHVVQLEYRPVFWQETLIAALIGAGLFMVSFYVGHRKKTTNTPSLASRANYY